jgi:tRNA threonylcarbamoyladenosine biosynthesis protein TsaE
VSSEPLQLELADADATLALGARLARGIPWQATRALTVFLQGELGAGKTTLVRGLLHELGVSGTVRSPSYSLVEHYALAAGEVLHVDLYRLADASEVESLGLRDAYHSGTLLLIEWPERAAAHLPAPDLRIDLQVVGEQRLARVSAAGPGLSWLAQIQR